MVRVMYIWLNHRDVLPFYLLSKLEWPLLTNIKFYSCVIALFLRVKASQPAERLSILMGAKWRLPKTSKSVNKLLQNPKEGDFWQADHIKAVAEGGGSCGLENLRTLCTPCHQIETEKLRSRLKLNSGDKKKNQGTTDIRNFLFRPKWRKDFYIHWHKHNSITNFLRSKDLFSGPKYYMIWFILHALLWLNHGFTSLSTLVRINMAPLFPLPILILLLK